LTNW